MGSKIPIGLLSILYHLVTVISSQCSSSDNNYEIIQFRWTIGNFSSSVDEPGRYIVSPTFPRNSDTETVWTLQIFPKGKISSTNYLAFYVCNDGSKSEIASYQLSILHKDFDLNGRYYTLGKYENVFSEGEHGSDRWGFKEFISRRRLSAYTGEGGAVDVFVQIERIRRPEDCQDAFKTGPGRTFGRNGITTDNVLSLSADHCTTAKGSKLETISYTWSDELPSESNAEFEINSPILPSSLGNKFQWQLELRKDSDSDDVQLYLGELKLENLPVIVIYSFSVVPFHKNESVPVRPLNIKFSDNVAMYTTNEASWGDWSLTTYSNFRNQYTNYSNHFEIQFSFSVFATSVHCNGVYPLTNMEPSEEFKKIVSLQEDNNELMKDAEQQKNRAAKLWIRNMDLEKKIESEERKCNLGDGNQEEKLQEESTKEPHHEEVEQEMEIPDDIKRIVSLQEDNNELIKDAEQRKNRVAMLLERNKDLKKRLLESEERKCDSEKVNQEEKLQEGEGTKQENRETIDHQFEKLEKTLDEILEMLEEMLDQYTQQTLNTES